MAVTQPIHIYYKSNLTDMDFNMNFGFFSITRKSDYDRTAENFAQEIYCRIDEWSHEEKFVFIKYIRGWKKQGFPPETAASFSMIQMVAMRDAIPEECSDALRLRCPKSEEIMAKAAGFEGVDTQIIAELYTMSRHPER